MVRVLSRGIFYCLKISIALAIHSLDPIRWLIYQIVLEIRKLTVGCSIALLVQSLDCYEISTIDELFSTNNGGTCLKSNSSNLIIISCYLFLLCVVLRINPLTKPIPYQHV